MVIGILALQGAVEAHARHLTSLGVAVRPVRSPGDLAGLAALVLPGGESTTISMQLESSGLTEPLRRAIAEGLPVLGTCAGMILLATGIRDGRPDQIALAALDIDVLRNGYGRQTASFETDLDLVPDGAEPSRAQRVHAVFIRAPRVTRVGPEVEILAVHDGHPVLVRQGSILAASFHPELTDDHAVHQMLVAAAEHHMTRHANDLEEV
ncbi:MAG: pyridoxal 5-phosphate synthase glutaminase subunit PdxT [Actinomycetota bacterium]